MEWGRLLLHALDVATVAGIYLYEVALVDEERYADLSTCLKSCRLESVCSCIALYAWLRVSDAKNSLYWHLSIENSICISVAYNLNDVALLHILNACNELRSDRSLVVCLLVHEDVVLTFLIKVLVWATSDLNLLELLTDVEATLKYATVGYVLQLDDHDCVTLTWLAVLEIDAHPDATVHTNCYTLLNVL